MSDILERLREADKTSPTETWAVWDLYREAADEIERLRAASQIMLTALDDAKLQLEGYEQEATGETYNSPLINKAIADGRAVLPSPPTQEGGE